MRVDFDTGAVGEEGPDWTSNASDAVFLAGWRAGEPALPAAPGPFAHCLTISFFLVFPFGNGQSMWSNLVAGVFKSFRLEWWGFVASELVHAFTDWDG